MSAVRASMWRAANRFGGRRMAAWSQNDQYRRGRWEKLGHQRRPMVTELVERLAAGGRVIEHACGEGHLALLIDPGAYSSYVGYDISDVAIASARQRAEHANRRFEVQDITSWPGDDGVQLIVAEECLYYLRPPQLRSFLVRCRNSLAPRGALLASFHDRAVYADTIAECRRQFPDHDAVEDENGSLYLVLRP